MASPAEHAAMRRALELAVGPVSPLLTAVAFGPNPRVGCVLLTADGEILAEGRHRGSGTPHAEVDALGRAGATAAGATAVVTLEPCAHTGRTGPCADALVAAGVRRVVYAQDDPNPVAAGGAARLRAGGVDVEAGLLRAEAVALNDTWTFAVRAGRPFVTWKVATTLDGRTAAADGTSRWITSEAARADVHRLRASAGAVVVGTGTVLADDPQLTVRGDGGSGAALPAPDQPLRVVVGLRPPPPGSRVLDAAAPTLVLATRDPKQVCVELAAREVRHALLEGGATLAGAFVAAGLVDRVVAYVAPVLLGDGAAALGSAGITTIADALRLRTEDVAAVGPDVRITARVDRAGEG